MDKKAAQHLKMAKDWMFWQLARDKWRACEDELDRYDRAHGFDWACDGDFRFDAYEHFCATDEEHKRIWADHMKASDDMHESLNRFCESMVRFTDGQVDFKTAKTMATNPRYAKKLEKIMMGKE